MLHPEAVTPEAHDVAAVDQAVDQGGCHDLIARPLAPLLKAVAAGEDSGGPVVASCHELHGAHAAPEQTADPIDDEGAREGRADKHLQAPLQSPSCLGFL